MKDMYGDEVVAGDRIKFSYGIPPIGVTAEIVNNNGELIALTPNHNPKECKLKKLKSYVGEWRKELK